MRIFLNDYTELTQEESLRYFEEDAENSRMIKEETHTAYLYLKTEWVGKMIQYAVVPNGFNPANIDEWGEEDWVFIEDIITIEAI